ncbi:MULTISPECIES: hypothetical protein [Catenuloplanes]|uniref:Uncharacterized protein n=1 Tax=Catenuloplanes niger TaxID=587534 RepID=A0AAE4CWG4_9ACTN|nr:hypothetical protein [Catenuloplanes niger]MDR7327205.1 hypothetical protein [Catenuloplanes niger]
MRYHYFSRRAINSLYEDNGGRSRPVITLERLRIPSLGNVTPEVEGRIAAGRTSRAAEAAAAERLLGDFVADDPASVAAAGEGFVRGRGDVWMTLYGTDDIDQPPHAGRVAFFVRCGEGGRTAMCLFGSRENCDGWLQDSHPDRVTGWALSSTADVLRWLNDADREWDHARWAGSVGLEALMMANYEAILGLGGFFGRRTDNAMSFVGRLIDVEWLALVYHVESVTQGDLPFDTIMIGRPFWIRSGRHRVQTTDVISLAGMRSRRDRPVFAERWIRWLRPAESGAGRPLYLYRSLCRVRHVSPDLG